MINLEAQVSDRFSSVEGCVGYVRHVTHDEIADEVG